MPRIPKGVPSITYCRIQSGLGAFNQGDVISDGNSVTVIEPGQSSTRHEVAQVLERGISDEQVCELTMGTAAGSGVGVALNPIAAFVNEAVTSVIFVIGSKQTKKWQFMKKTVLPFVANEMFHHISEKDHVMSSQFYKAQINFSAFEIQDEVITDLIRPVNRGLNLSVTAEDGTVVAGIHKETITEEMELRQLLVDACDNRASHTLPIGGSIDSSSAIFEFTLYQSEGSYTANSSGIKECTSRLIVVDVASIDPLVAGNAQDIRSLEGPTLHKSLVTFYEVLKKLSTPTRASVAPFRAAKLTHYLNELLGGNAIVVGLGLLANGEPSVTRKTLDVLGALNTSVHYPIGGRELTDTLHGLLTKYRATVLSMQDELANKDALNHTISSSEHEVEKKLVEAQKAIASATIEKNEAIHDRERIFEMTELLKAKYTTLMNEKIAQSEELAQAEEDKIDIAKALMEQKLQYTQLVETSEKEKFDLNVALTTQKNTNEQLLHDIAALDVDKQALKNTIDELNADKEVLRGEIHKLNGDVQEKEAAYQSEKERNLELGAELLTLVNRRDLLQAEVDNFNTKYNAISDELKAKVEQLEETEGKLNRISNENRTKDEEIFELKKQCAEVDIENKRMKLLVDKMELENREKKLIKGTVTSEETIAQTAKYEELLATNKKCTKMIKDLEKQNRRLQADLEQTQKEKAAQGVELNEVREKYRTKLSSLLIHDTENDLAYHRYHNQKKDAAAAAAAGLPGSEKHGSHHHHRLSKSQRKASMMKSSQSLAGGSAASLPIHEEDERDDEQHKQQREKEGEGVRSESVDDSEGGSGVGGSSAKLKPAAAAGDVVPGVHSVSTTAMLQQQMIDSYTAREKKNNEELDASLAQRDSMKNAYRTLYDKYRATLEMVEEYLPKASSLKVKVLEEQLKFGEENMKEADAVLDEMELQERKANEEKLQRAEQARLDESERMTFVLATYQRNLEIAEGKLTAAQAENVDLHIQINQLISNMTTLQQAAAENPPQPQTSSSPANKQVEPAPAMAAVPPMVLPDFEKRDAKQLEMFEALSNEIKDLRRQLLESRNREKSLTNAASAAAMIPTSRVPTPAAATLPDVFEAPPEVVAAEIKPTPPQTPVKPTTPVAVVEQRRKSTPAAAVVPPAAPAPVDPTIATTIAEYKAYIKQLESNASDAMSQRLRIAEVKALDMATKNAALQEELASYQAYMRDVVPQYKKQIQYMKQQLSVALKAIPAAAKEVPPKENSSGNELKLPPLLK